LSLRQKCTFTFYFMYWYFTNKQFHETKLNSLISTFVIVIDATSFCVNWAFLIARGTRLKHKRSDGFKASRAIRKAQFTQKRVAGKILLFETTSLKLPNLLKMVSHLLLTVLTNFSRPVRNVTLNVLSRVTLNVLSRATVRYLLILL
jgi:hypothetical protein